MPEREAGGLFFPPVCLVKKGTCQRKARFPVILQPNPLEFETGLKTHTSYRLQNSDTKKGTLMLISIPCKMASGMASLPE